MVQSISKTAITQQQAASIVDAAFEGQVSLVSMRPCEEGWFNAVHRLGLSDGRDVILKVAPLATVRVLRYEYDIIRTEVDALRLVAERTTVPVPRVLRWDPTSDLVPSPSILMEACPGTLLSELRPTLDPEAAAHVDGQIAQHLAAMNAIEAPAFGRPAAVSAQHPTWSAAFTHLVDDVLADGRDAEVELPTTTDDISALVQAAAGDLDAVGTPRFVHWDLWDPNVFVDPDTLDVVGIIDFERVLWADPLIEGQFLGKRSNDSLVEAYGTPLFDEPGAVERRRLYDLYLYLVMLVECAYRNYGTDDIEQLARACLPVVLDEIHHA